MRIAYLDCFSGISGDMLLGALVDAGVPFSLLEETAGALNVGAHLKMRTVTRGGLTGTKIDVVVEGSERHVHDDPGHSHEQTHHAHLHDHQHEHPHGGDAHDHEHAHADGTVHSHEHGHGHQPHRPLSTILQIIDSAPLSGSVKRRAFRAFQLLGEAEARIHSMPIEKVQFHEVGAVDTIVDIVCAAVGCEHLNADRWLASPLNVGSGTVECAHGVLPVPAPATLALLGDAPIYASGPSMERVTPTGAAILRMLEVDYAPMPTMRISRSGYGAGGRDTPGQPNLLRILVGEESASESAAEPIAIMETVIDDSSPQLIAYVSELLLEAGAWDVYRIPVQMKKGRTGVKLTVLCHPDRLPTLRDLLFRETTTIGLHWRLENKISLAREFKEVQTEWGPVRMKIARWASGEIANAAPEYEDCRQLAVAHSVPLKEVIEQARRVFAAHEEERQ
jgi:pyridinium-3,5-bisthiocarboxylic acid mononucleotide nickel chelatase